MNGHGELEVLTMDSDDQEGQRWRDARTMTGPVISREHPWQNSPNFPQ